MHTTRIKRSVRRKEKRNHRATLIELVHTKLIAGKQAHNFTGWKHIWLFGLGSRECWCSGYCLALRLALWDLRRITSSSNKVTFGGLFNLMLNGLGEKQVMGLLNDKSLLRDWCDDSKWFNHLTIPILKTSCFINTDCMFVHLFTHNEQLGNQDDSSSKM